LLWLTIKLFASDFHTSACAFDLFPYNLHGKWLLVDSIGGEGSSAANDYVKLYDHTDLASLQFDPGGYHSGGFVFDPGGSLQVDPHCFIKSTNALSQERPIDINIHCFSIALLRYQVLKVL